MKTIQNIAVILFILRAIALIGQEKTGNMKFVEYQAITRFKEIDIAMSDSEFIYHQYQDVTFFCACGNYKTDIYGYLTFTIDTLATNTMLDSLNRNRKKYIMPPDFSKNRFRLQSDTIECKLYDRLGYDNVFYAVKREDD